MYTMVVSPWDFEVGNHGSNPSGGIEFLSFPCRWAGCKHCLIWWLKWAAERVGLEWRVSGPERLGQFEWAGRKKGLEILPLYYY
jgi:hypothetical protein